MMDAMATDPLTGFEVEHLDIPPVYLQATGRIRGFWRRELLVLAGAFGLGGLLVFLLTR